MVLRIKGVMSRLHYSYINIQEAMRSPDVTTYQKERLSKAADIINSVLIAMEDDTGIVYDPPRKRSARRK